MVRDARLMEPNITPALIGVIGSIGVGLMMIGSAMFFKIFKGPAAQNDDLARIITKIGDKVERHGEDRAELATNVATLTVEVNHLSKNVERLSNEVMYMRQGEVLRNGRSTRRAAAD
jgi:hypothetical protein